MDRKTLAAIWGGSLIVSLGVGFLLGFSLGGSVERMGAQAGPAAVRSKRLTRGEFERLVVGRTREQILQVLGRPSRTSNVGGGDWTYEGMTVDPVSGRVDRHASIYFEGGVAERVLCH